MTPHPGTPRGNALPVRPGPAQGTRRVLAALVLAVLTLVGGAPAAGAALPVGALGSLASAVAYTPGAPAPAPQADRTTHPGGPHHDLRRTRPAPSPAGAGAGGRNARDHQPGPQHLNVRTGPARLQIQSQPQKPPQPQPHKHHPQARSLHERSLAAAEPTTPNPRAGIGRAHLTGHAPPPSYEGLLPAPAGPVPPCGRTAQPTPDSSSTPSGRRGAQPGVRGPPNSTAAGHPAGHPSRCSADPASRPR